MKGQWTATALALVLAGPALAGDDDRAVPRGGSSGGSSSVGSSHHSGGSGSASSSSHSGSSGSSSGSSDGSSSYSAPPPTGAQQRHPRAGTGTGGRYYSHGGYYYSPYYSPYYYNPYYWNWGLGFSFGYPAFYPGYYGYGGYGYGGYAYAPSGGGYSAYRVGSVRVMVEPHDTRVYVDGYYAGVADDFDGLFQRLNLSSGRHEIALKLDGHRTFKVKVYVPLDQTVKLRHRMEEGSGEEISPDVIGQPEAYEDAGRGRDDRDVDERGDYSEGPVAGEEGSLRLLVNPDDASVYVDGDFRGTVRQVRRLRLSPGRHRVELVRPGFRTFEREVEVHPGRDSDLQIDLDRS